MQLTARYRMAVLSRAVAAILGGYALAAFGGSCIALLMRTSRAEAALTGMMSGFLIYALAVLWTFAARRTRTALIGLALPTAATGALYYFLR